MATLGLLILTWAITYLFMSGKVALEGEKRKKVENQLCELLEKIGNTKVIR